MDIEREIHRFMALVRSDPGLSDDDLGPYKM